MRLFGRLLVLPFKLLLATFETAFAAGRVVGRVPVHAGRHTSRILGFRGTLGLLAGLALGLAFAPGPGRELRARVKRLLARSTVTSDADLVVVDRGDEAGTD